MLCFCFGGNTVRLKSKKLIQFLNFSLIVKIETDLYISYNDISYTESRVKMQDTVNTEANETNLVVAEKFLMSCINYREKFSDHSNLKTYKIINVVDVYYMDEDISHEHPEMDEELAEVYTAEMQVHTTEMQEYEDGVNWTSVTMNKQCKVICY